MFDDRETEAALGEELGGRERLVEHHRAVCEHDRVVALAQQPASTELDLDGAARSCRGDGPIASLIATFPSASSTAQRRSARVSSELAGWTIVISGSAPSSEMSRTDWCDFPGPAGTSPA